MLRTIETDTKQIKAIETEYKGYRFRSRTEARWAVFLDSFNEEWQYEVEGYELPSGRYLPDFWLPRLYCWLEIKGEKPTESEEQLCYELACATDKPVAIAWGLPFAVNKYREWKTAHQGVRRDYLAERLKVFCNDCTDSSGGESWWDESFWAIDLGSRLCICSNNDRSDRSFVTPNWESFPGMTLISEINRPITQKQAGVAKSARFEFQR